MKKLLMLLCLISSMLHAQPNRPLDLTKRIYLGNGVYGDKQPLLYSTQSHEQGYPTSLSEVKHSTEKTSGSCLCSLQDAVNNGYYISDAGGNVGLVDMYNSAWNRHLILNGYGFRLYDATLAVDLIYGWVNLGTGKPEWGVDDGFGNTTVMHEDRVETYTGHHFRSYVGADGLSGSGCVKWWSNGAPGGVMTVEPSNLTADRHVFFMDEDGYYMPPHYNKDVQTVTAATYIDIPNPYGFIPTVMVFTPYFDCGGRWWVSSKSLAYFRISFSVPYTGVTDFDYSCFKW